MNDIRAFVGHSFTDDDKEITNTFLEYLDTIKGLSIGFTWDHAKEAESVELVEKVRRIIRDKNLFIGICTKKECVIDPGGLKKCLIGRSTRKVSSEKIYWKTSDWIIQEIGMAVGREMNLILLIEKGLRRPGGLQGNIEYIEFNREKPSDSFGKILEMIKGLFPKRTIIKTEEQKTAIPEKTEDKSKKDANDDWWQNPETDWKDTQFMAAMICCIEEGNSEIEDKINSAFYKTQKGGTSDGQAVMKAWCQYLRLSDGKNGSLKQMEQLAKDNPDVEDVNFFLADAYVIYKEYRKAGEAYLYAAKAPDVKSKLRCLGEAARAFYLDGSMHKTDEIIMQMKEASKSGDDEKLLLETLKRITSIESNPHEYFGLLERQLELDPGDTTIRFDLAYKYSLNSEENLSLFHYLRIRESERSNVVWNNLGVQYSELKMPSFSIQAYRKSEKMGETLAMSNIANIYINAGLLTEAENLCKKAQKIEDYHNNINHSMIRIKEIPQEESRREQSIIIKTTPYSDFYKEYGKALSKNDVAEFSGVWSGPKCSFALAIKKRSFSADGTYRVLNSALGALVNGSDNIDEQPTIKIISYQGKISGYSIKATYKERIEPKPKGLISGIVSKTEREVLMTISDSLSEIRVFDKGAAESERFYLLKKAENSI